MRHRLVRIAALISAAALAACASHAAAPLPSPATGFGHAVASPSGGGGTNGGSVYVMGDGSTETAFTTDFNLGADGKIYYASMPAYNNGWSTIGEIGTFDPSTHAQTYQIVPYAPGFIKETADGSVWVTELNNVSGNPTVDRYTGINGSDTPIAMGFGPLVQGAWGNGIDGGLAIAPDNTVWIGSNNSGQVGAIDPANNTSHVYALNIPSGGATPMPQFMTFASDHNLWVTDAANTGVYRVVAQGSSIGSNTFTRLPENGRPYANGVQGIIQAPDGKLYTGNPGYPDSGWLDRAKVGASPSFTSMSLPAIGARPYVFAASGTKLYFLEYHFIGLGVYDVVSKKLAVLPLVTYAEGNLTFDSTGTLWTSCYMPASGTSCIQNVPIASTWEPFPSRSVTLYTQWNNQALPPGIIGIGETGDSGPFTVTSSNPSICTAAMIPHFDHDVQVNPVAVGHCAVTITDAHSRSAKVSVSIVNGSGIPQMRRDPSRSPSPVTEEGR